METQVSALAGAEVENNVLSSLFRVEGESFPVGLRGGSGGYREEWERAVVGRSMSER